MNTEESRRAAVGLIRRGVAPIPVPAGRKKPILAGWEALRISEEDVPRFWTNGQNVGVLCGEPSGWRVDVDLDSPEAVALAARFLEPTLTSGREHRPRSHWWYRCAGAESRDWKDTDRSKLVELRSTGRQTLVAPSTHPGGDRYVWHRESGLEAAQIPPEELAESLVGLATAALIARHAPPAGGRHDFALSVAGFVLRRGRLDQALTLKVLRAAWHAAGADSREAVRDLEGIVRDTAARIEAGERVVGGPTLEESAPGVVALLCKWWGWNELKEAAPEPAGTGILLSEVEPERVRWLWEHRIALGKLNLVDGDPGTGKSAATTDLAARVSAGKPWPDGSECPAGGVVILSAEDGLADTIRPRFDAAGGDPSKAVAVSTVACAGGAGNERQIAIPGDLATIEAAIERVGAVLVVVDPLMAFLPGDVNSHRDQDVRRALAPLARLAERTGAAVVVVRHLNKATGGNALYRGGGSIAFVGAARSGLLIAKHPEGDGRRVLASIKSNLAAPAPSLVFGLESTGTGAVRVDWKGESNLNAEALLSAPTDPEERSVLQEARNLLREVLSEGPVPASEVRQEARSADISERTLKSAKRELGVLTDREGEPGKRGGGKWVWRLPTGPISIKGAKPEGLHPKPVADLTDDENSLYSSQVEAVGLRGQNTEDIKETNGACTLNRPLSAGLAPGQSATLAELRKKRPAVFPEKARKLLKDPPGWLHRQIEHARKQGFPAGQLKALAAATAAEACEDGTKGEEILPTVTAFLTHGVGCDCQECA